MILKPHVRLSKITTVLPPLVESYLYIMSFLFKKIINSEKPVFRQKRKKAKMKLAVAFIASVTANPNKLNQFGKKKSGTEITRSIPESCVATFDRLSAEFVQSDWFSTSPSLDIVNLRTSGHIDIHNYGGGSNCFIEVVADVACQEITAEIVHAGLERCTNINTGGECQCDKFWFNDESTPEWNSPGGLCGCGGSNQNPAPQAGCNDFFYDNNGGFAENIFGASTWDDYYIQNGIENWKFGD